MDEGTRGSIAQKILALMASAGGHRPPRPPLSPKIVLTVVEDAELGPVPDDDTDELQAISGLACIIEYQGELRDITCHRYDLIGDVGYVGATCEAATGHGYRQFRCDRISSVIDYRTGEIIGDGSYFERFAVHSRRERAPTFGLTPGRKSLLVAGLNVLTFLARCDGEWHDLEEEQIEAFVVSMWLRKEWDGDPPIEEIVAHARRLAPDSRVALKALKSYAASDTSSRVLLNAMAQVIDADGIIRKQEVHWASEMQNALRQLRAQSVPANPQI